ncbi:F-box protein SKIP23-like [Tripterygium wilfordii]|uniref:F-box protein SKIP23-like n=1 Tax=Tripterygium wilfordii TaxID=458696 RepID=A0A7J7D2A5_TRIWF|nr:F-box protein SKIP23-like [Tripterygium wilfordii]XP_038716615.1 F-box protein SKIP23-like [Tripterygium wilfordii]KAF5740408.1 F-box protein SKIP23-like [Tripterygium wilfordii]
MEADWSSLNSDLLEAIANRLRIEDYVRVQAVCKPWRLLIERFPRHPHNQLPWLALPPAENSNTCRFYSFTERKLHHIELPELRERRCCGSSHGWMVMVDKSPDVFLLNPLTGSRIPLPPITTFPQVEDFLVSDDGDEKYCYRPHVLDRSHIYSGKLMQSRFLNKVALTGNPSVTRDYMVLAIYGDLEHLAFCREGDDNWTLVHQDDAKLIFEDVVYWKGNLYAVDYSGRLIECDLGGPIPEVKRILTTRLIIGDRSYLVVSGEELLLVSRTKECCFGERHYRRTKKFMVFKLDEESLTWVEVADLRDRMFFVGNNFALSLSANDFPECKANYIYFTDDCVNGYVAYIKGTSKHLYGGHDLGAYDMTNGKIEPFPCFPEFTCSTWPPPFWSMLSPY